MGVMMFTEAYTEEALRSVYGQGHVTSGPLARGDRFGRRCVLRSPPPWTVDLKTSVAQWGQMSFWWQCKSCAWRSRKYDTQVDAQMALLKMTAHRCLPRR